jgi:hypothetical protein
MVIGKPYASQRGKKLRMGVDDVNSHVAVACQPYTSTAKTVSWSWKFTRLNDPYWP